MSVDINGNEINSEDSIKNGNEINSEDSIKNVFKEKLGEFISLDINKIQISEFNTRCQFLDNLHVKTLMDSIEKRGYIPKSAVWVNAVTDNGTKQGNIIQYRLVAGRHRYEACLRIELKEIPCQLYYNLTDIEECEFDRIDNELDEHHKPFHFLDEAEHYKYLRDIKGWSQRQIARAKNVSKGIVHYRLTISALSEEIKSIIKSAHHGGHLVERYMREILKLTSIPHQILVCKEIIGGDNKSLLEPAGSNDQKGVVDLKCNLIQNYTTQSELEARVKWLLALEEQGKIAEEAIPFVKDKAELENIFSNSSNFQGNNSNSKVKEDEVSGQVFFKDYSSVNDNPERERKNENPKQSQSKKTATSNKPAEEKKDKQKAEQLIFEIFAMISEKREDNGLRFGVKPLWIKHVGLVKELSCGAYLVLLELIENDFRYKPKKKDSFFFLTIDDNYADCVDYLSHVGGVKPVTLVKKVFPELERFVFYKKNDRLYFQLKWDKLYEIYKNNANRIPFNDGGLKNIPSDYSGWIRPTPYHAIYIENGVIKKIEKNGQDITSNQEVNNSPAHGVKVGEVKSQNIEVKKADVSQEIKKERIEQKAEEPVKPNPEFKSKQVSKAHKEKSNSPLAIFLRERGMAEEMINFCLVRESVTKNVIKLLNEISPAQKENIKNIPGYIYKLVHDGFTPPEGFETVEEVEERRENKRKTEEFGEKIRKEFEEGRIKYFNPKEGLKYPLSIIPNNFQFLYKKSNGMPSADNFSEWMDEKFFTG
jgi:hypothetical protein